ncbi:MAG: phage tail tape measure protein, partial [Deltaproteobacteria bacterium]|nr:phage tail tape measure protein [Deltaproteobacteria bacterium]
KVLSDTDGDVSQFTESVFELSNKYGISSAEILQSAANFKQSGFETAEAFDLVSVALDQAIAGELEAAASSELLIAALKGFKAPASDAARLVDVLNETSNNYATNLEQLAIGMAKFSPIASQMGLSFEETAGVLTPVIEVFRSGDEAAIALRTGMLKLIDDTKPVQEALAAIGVSQTDANGALRSGKDILKDVSLAFQTADKNQKLFLTQQLVGIQQSAKMVEVFDGLAKSQDITATAMRAAGSAAEEVTKRLESAEIAVQRSITGFENLATVIGLNFKNEVVDVINGVTALEIAMQNVVTDGGLEPLFEALGPQIKSISDLLQAMAKNLPEAFKGIDFSRLVNSFGDLGDEVKKAFEAFFGPVDLTTVAGLQGVIQSLIDGIAVLTDVSGGIVAGFKPFLEQLGKMKDVFFDMDEATAKNAGNLLGMATAINELIGPLQSALGAVSGLGAAMEIMAGVQVVKLAGSLGVGGAITAGLWAFSAGAIASGAAAGGLAGILLAENVPAYNAFINKLTDLTAAGLGIAFFQEETNKLTKAGTNLTRQQIEAFKERLAVLNATPTSIETEIAVDATIDPNIQRLLDDPEALAAEIKVSINKESVITAQNELAKTGGAAVYDAATGTWYNTVSMAPVVDDKKANEARKKLETEFATKTVELETEFDIAKVQAQAAILDSAFQYKATVDIANIEANVKIIESLGDGIQAIFASTGDILSGLFGQLDDGPFSSKFLIITAQIKEENELRKRALKLQEDLTAAQIRLMDLKSDALQAGDSLISITADGLEPELEAFMWRIIERVQIRAAAEQAEFLLGIETA